MGKDSQQDRTEKETKPKKGKNPVDEERNNYAYYTKEGDKEDHDPSIQEGCKVQKWERKAQLAGAKGNHASPY